MQIKKGYNIPVNLNADIDNIEQINPSLIGIKAINDFFGIKPSVKVEVGDNVKVGQPLFFDKYDETVPVVSTVSGKVKEINRGEKRSLLSIVVENDNNYENYNDYKPFDTSENIKSNLILSGIWASFRKRPFNRVPKSSDTPAEIFITGTDTKPLSPNAGKIIRANKEKFIAGAEIISKLFDVKINICFDFYDDFKFTNNKIKTHIFNGVHPAGNAGTHMHFLSGASINNELWSIDYQTVLNIAEFAQTGSPSYKKIITLGGNGIKNDKYISTITGASFNEIIGDNLLESPVRIIDGSLICGSKTCEKSAYLGINSMQISTVIDEAEIRTVGWVRPYFDKFSSFFNVHLSSIFNIKDLKMDTAINGSHRAILSLGQFEELTPLDILPEQLLKSIFVGDTDMAQKLGILELHEEDIALFAYSDIGKNDYLSAFNECMLKIEKEG